MTSPPITAHFAQTQWQCAQSGSGCRARGGTGGRPWAMGRPLEKKESVAAGARLRGARASLSPGRARRQTPYGARRRYRVAGLRRGVQTTVRICDLSSKGYKVEVRDRDGHSRGGARLRRRRRRRRGGGAYCNDTGRAVPTGNEIEGGDDLLGLFPRPPPSPFLSLQLPVPGHREPRTSHCIAAAAQPSRYAAVGARPLSLSATHHLTARFERIR